MNYCQFVAFTWRKNPIISFTELGPLLLLLIIDITFYWFSPIGKFMNYVIIVALMELYYLFLAGKWSKWKVPETGHAFAFDEGSRFKIGHGGVAGVPVRQGGKRSRRNWRRLLLNRCNFADAQTPVDLLIKQNGKLHSVSELRRDLI